MSRYIDAEALDNRIKAECAKQEDDKGYGVAHFFVETQPTADVAPVVHGEWNKMGNTVFICSVCDELESVQTPYCPICGAKMYEEEKQ